LQEIHGDLRTELAQKDWGIMNLGMLKSRKLAGLRENSDGMCSRSMVVQRIRWSSVLGRGLRANLSG
jgi:hypothetical protein